MKKWLKNLSTKNKKRMKKVLEITLDSLEMRSYYYGPIAKFSLNRFEEKGFSREEIKGIFNAIVREEGGIVYFMDSELNQLRYGIPEDLNDFLASPIDNTIKKSEYDILKSQVSKEKGRFFLLYIGNLDRLCKITKNLKEKTEKEAKPDKKEEKEGGDNAKEEIEKITIAVLKKKYKIIINDNWEEKNIRESRKGKKRPEQLIQAIRNKDKAFENIKESANITDSIAEYYNCTSKCQLYSRGKYDFTKIFTEWGQDVKINPDVETKIIDDEEEFQKKIIHTS